MLPKKWFSKMAPQVAQDLVGCRLFRKVGQQTVRGTIIETEAYEQGDPAMHGYRRKTARSAVTFGPAGYLYVYLIYGVHHCLNFVTDADGKPSAVLIRAVELDKRPPWLDGPSKREELTRLAAGPGKLCRALNIDTTLSGSSLSKAAGVWVGPRPKQLQSQIEGAPNAIVQTTRIGLTKAVETPWRWYLADSPAVSRR